MADTLLTTGLVCLVAAIVGGGLKAFGFELPALRSGRRQVALGALGLVLLGASYWTQPRSASQAAPTEVLLFDTKNDAAVQDNPPRPAEFTISRPHVVTSIWNYHWNGGRGVTPGHIALRRADGTVFGPWEVTAADRQAMIDWNCRPNTRIPAGTYTIVDSEHARWSWNARTEGRGTSKVKGYPVD